jgi:hypothetical protein
VSGRGTIRRTPWILCGIAVALVLFSPALRWAMRGDSDIGSDEWLEATLEGIGVSGIPVVGALIAARLPTNPYGWIWCGVGLAFGMSEFSEVLRVTAVPVWIPSVVQGWAFTSFLTLMVFVFLLFPTGRLPTPRWRWVARAAVGDLLLLAALVPFGTDPAEPADATPWAVQGAAGRVVFAALLALAGAMFALLLAGMASLVLRFRRAGPAERRQLAWFVYATVLLAAYLVLDTLGVIPSGWIEAVLNSVTLAVLPVAVGVAVLRYRLYEIDRIVSRTVSYGLLTAGLIGLYLLVVAVLRPLLEPVTGSSALAVAGSTLAVAAVFNPARRRLQAGVDRRFDRARYDAARAVDEFAARLRGQVDLDQVTAGLHDTVVATVAPTRVAVWLRVPARPGGAR